MRRLVTALIFPWFFPLSYMVCAPIAIAGVMLTGRQDFAHKMGKFWSALVFAACGIKVKTRMLAPEAIRPPVVFACNHASQMDILALYIALPVEFRFLVKKELFKVPLLGFAMKKAGYIPIDRKNSRAAVKSIKEAAERLKRGASIVIFPEGTRSPDGRLQEFKEGGFMLAIKSGCPVVPVAIKGSHKVLPKGAFIARPGTIEVTVGRPIEVESEGKRLSRSEIASVTHEVISKMLEGSI
ncbi:MAG: 1-acyl-sn-glycerol-3-phosphate acyltransferase [Thermodesulfobacteria bacterium]|nr:1-acyl-sn-glycerol-3-phosphate acyltransferase [Thermodesulfobacteriota bacterium]